jgi:hypothetical protein
MFTLDIRTEQHSDMKKVKSDMKNAACLQILVAHVAKSHATVEASEISEAARAAYQIVQPALMNYLHVALYSPTSHSFSLNLETWLAWLDQNTPNLPSSMYVKDNFYFYSTLLADFVVCPLF